MAKRLTDCEKWKKPFIRSLDTSYKLLWLYILDDCDHAGMWQVDLEVAQIRTGEKLTLEKAIEMFSEKIQIFDNGEKWFIQDFVDFQYGQLNPENRVHKSVMQLLEKYKNKGLSSPLQGAKDKDKDKDKGKDKEKDKADPKFILSQFENFWKAYDKKQGEINCQHLWLDLTPEERLLILEYVPKYVASTPDKIFRKNPANFLENRGWEDEIVFKEKIEPKKEPVYATIGADGKYIKP